MLIDFLCYDGHEKPPSTFIIKVIDTAVVPINVVIVIQYVLVNMDLAKCGHCF